MSSPLESASELPRDSTEQNEEVIENTENEEDNVSKLKKMIEDLINQNREYEESNQSMKENTETLTKDNEIKEQQKNDLKARYQQLLDNPPVLPKGVEAELNQYNELEKSCNIYENRVNYFKEIKKDQTFYNQEMSKIQQEIIDIQNNVNNVVEKYPDLENKAQQYQNLFSLISELNNINDLFINEAKNCILANESNPELFEATDVAILQEKINKGDEIKRDIFSSESDQPKFPEVEKSFLSYSEDLDRCLPLYNQLFLIVTTKAEIIDKPKEDKEGETSDNQDSSLKYKFVCENIDEENAKENQFNVLKRIAQSDDFGYLNDPTTVELFNNVKNAFTLIINPEIKDPDKIDNTENQEQAEEPNQDNKTTNREPLTMDRINGLFDQQQPNQDEQQPEEKQIEETKPEEPENPEKLENPLTPNTLKNLVEQPNETKPEEEQPPQEESKSEEKQVEEQPPQEEPKQQEETLQPLAESAVNGLLGGIREPEQPADQQSEQPPEQPEEKQVEEQPPQEELKQEEETLQPLAEKTLNGLLGGIREPEQPADQQPEQPPEQPEEKQVEEQPPQEEPKQEEETLQPLAEKAVNDLLGGTQEEQPPEEKPPEDRPSEEKPPEEQSEADNLIQEEEEEVETEQTGSNIDTSVLRKILGQPGEETNEKDETQDKQQAPVGSERTLPTEEKKPNPSEPSSNSNQSPRVDVSNLKAFLGQPQEPEKPLETSPRNRSLTQSSDNTSSAIQRRAAPSVRHKPFVIKKKEPFVSSYDPSIFYTPLTTLESSSSSTTPTVCRSKYTEPPPLTITLKDIGLEGLDSPIPDKTQQIKSLEKAKSRRGKRKPKTDENGNIINSSRNAKVIRPVRSPNKSTGDAKLNSHGPKSPRRNRGSSRRKIAPMPPQETSNNEEFDSSGNKKPPSLLESAQNSSNNPQLVIPDTGHKNSSRSSRSGSRTGSTHNEPLNVTIPDEEESNNERSPRRINSPKQEEEHNDHADEDKEPATIDNQPVAKEPAEEVKEPEPQQDQEEKTDETKQDQADNTINEENTN